MRWLVLSFFSVLLVQAQTLAINGSVRGRVTDQTGSPIADGKVTVSNSSTGFTRSLTTGDDGYYVFPNLPLGTYVVRSRKAVLPASGIRMLFSTPAAKR